MVKTTDKVVISQEEYDTLEKEVEFLNCLRACGVDSWDGWDLANEMMYEDIE